MTALSPRFVSRLQEGPQPGAVHKRDTGEIHSYQAARSDRLVQAVEELRRRG